MGVTHEDEEYQRDEVGKRGTQGKPLAHACRLLDAGIVGFHGGGAAVPGGLVVGGWTGWRRWLGLFRLGPQTGPESRR